MAEESSSTTGISRKLTEAVNVAKLVQLTRVIRLVGNKFPLVKQVFQEVQSTTEGELRESVLSLCEDNDGRRIAEEALLGGNGSAAYQKPLIPLFKASAKEDRTEIKRKLVDTMVYPVFEQAKKKPKNETHHQTTKTISQTNRPQTTSCLSDSPQKKRIPAIPKHVPSDREKKRIDDIFAADAQRRTETRMLHKKAFYEEAPKEDAQRGEEKKEDGAECRKLWATKSKKCGRCWMWFHDSMNEDDLCAFHDGALRKSRVSSKPATWTCCGVNELDWGCTMGKHMMEEDWRVERRRRDKRARQSSAHWKRKRQHSIRGAEDDGSS